MRLLTAHFRLAVGFLIGSTATACDNLPKAQERETSLAMPDSAHAFLARMRKAIQDDDSARYMSEYPANLVWLNNGKLFEGRQSMARAVGPNLRASTGKDDITFSNERIEVVGPRAAAMSLGFTLTSTDSTEKSTSQTGVWSGIIGVRDGKAVMLQEHVSTEPTKKR